MSKFTEIAVADMHGFLVSRGFTLLNLRDPAPGYMAPGDYLPKVPADLERSASGPGTWELTYGKRVFVPGSDGQFTLRVYTTLTLRDGTRAKGTDAIRVVLFWREVEDGVGLAVRPVGGEKKVLRVLGWRANLGARLEKWSDDLVGPSCPRCGRPMVERGKGKASFWGCTGYRRENPVCRFTMPLAGKSPAPAPVKASGSTGCECGCGVMVVRQGRYGDFLGCSAYPRCRRVLSAAAAA